MRHGKLFGRHHQSTREAAHVKISTGHTHTHTTAEQATHTNIARATAQRRLIVAQVVAAPKIVVHVNVTHICIDRYGCICICLCIDIYRHAARKVRSLLP